VQSGDGGGTRAEGEVNGMEGIRRNRARLEEARGPAATMTAGWGAFHLVVVVCRQAGHGSRELFAPFAFAAEAAAQGRAILSSAVPGPADAVDETFAGETGAAGLGRLADALADLAGVLGERLASAAAEAADPADRAACAEAAAQAAAVRGLLAGDS
jgi:hypothetical protein